GTLLHATRRCQRRPPDHQQRHPAPRARRRRMGGAAARPAAATGHAALAVARPRAAQDRTAGVLLLSARRLLDARGRKRRARTGARLPANTGRALERLTPAINPCVRTRWLAALRPGQPGDISPAVELPACAA